jgi:hypothetical protein
METTLSWLIDCDEPWTRYRVRLDLLHEPVDSPAVQAERQALLSHPQVQGLLASALSWGEQPLKRHNDAAHPLYAISTLADFGLQAGDPGVDEITQKLLAHQSVQGAFLSPVQISSAFGGRDMPQWTWLACDAPTLLVALLSFGLAHDPCVQQAAAHLQAQCTQDGYLCSAAPELGRFHGPGRRSDPCPIANVYALKALSLLPAVQDLSAAHRAAEMLLNHWRLRAERKFYLFGVGSDFRKLKYPFIWYDLLHVCEVLSRYPFVHNHPGYREMLAELGAQADEQGHYTAGSMYQSWKGWSFADKKHPSPWLTFLAQRILNRSG